MLQMVVTYAGKSYIIIEIQCICELRLLKESVFAVLAIKAEKQEKKYILNSVAW